jgi:hypothetical protein
VKRKLSFCQSGNSPCKPGEKGDCYHKQYVLQSHVVDGTGYLNGLYSLGTQSFLGFACRVSFRAEIPVDAVDAPCDKNSARSVVFGALHARFFILHPGISTKRQTRQNQEIRLGHHMSAHKRPPQRSLLRTGRNS